MKSKSVPQFGYINSVVDTIMFNITTCISNYNIIELPIHSSFAIL